LWNPPATFGVPGRTDGSVARWPPGLRGGEPIPLIIVFGTHCRGAWLCSLCSRVLSCWTSGARYGTGGSATCRCPVRPRSLASSLRSAHSAGGAGLHEVPGRQGCQQHRHHEQRNDDQSNLIVADRRAELGEDEHALQGSGITAGVGGS